MTAGLGLCAVGLGGVGLTLLPGFGTPWLIACRLVTGCGVSFLVGGAIMFMGDISTSVNRTRTMAPVLASFQGGTALGPALGGVMVENIGISPTYGAVGGLFGVITGLNYLLLKETIPLRTRMKPQPQPEVRSQTSGSHANSHSRSQKEHEQSHGVGVGGLARGVASSFGTAYSSWRRLVRVDLLRDVTLMNGLYWTTFAGTQMTLLPLFIIGPQFNFGASQIGMTFAFMSVVAVLASQPVAVLTDRYGKIPSILCGSGLMASSMFMLPSASSLEELLFVLLPFAVGSTALGSAPTALVTNATTPEDRSQALAMLRTAGDLGHLAGAFSAGATLLLPPCDLMRCCPGIECNLLTHKLITIIISNSGLIAHFFSLEYALYADASLLTASMVWYGYKCRNIARSANGEDVENGANNSASTAQDATTSDNSVQKDRRR
jgi:MFS family permease